MKKSIIFILALLSVITFSSCSVTGNRSSTVKLNFYYLQADSKYNKSDGMICAEKRKIAKVSSEEEWVNAINLYLSGPNDGRYISPFPDGTKLKRHNTAGNTLTIFLSNEISQLEGYDLTIACACLTKTILETKAITSVEIRAEGGKMGDSISITMTQDNLLMLDNYSPPESN